ncbi:MAG: hypothetical protein A2Z29_04100 [Chloroflexi bacterium RBG_16_56_11]|nr:MAG: hypothetical protein A2Z29_04100 [Chloroflexi bacterium RBG_16_56_11]
MADTSTGLKENVAGVLCYVGWWISGIVFLILEPNNKFVRFHAFQSIVVFVTITVALGIFGWVPTWAGNFLRAIIWGIGFILWVVLMVLASQDKKYKLPVAGDLAEKWAG